MEAWGLVGSGDGDAEDFGAIADRSMVFLWVEFEILVGRGKAMGLADFLDAVPPSALVDAEQHLVLEVQKQLFDIGAERVAEGKGFDHLLPFIGVEESDARIYILIFSEVFSWIGFVPIDVDGLLEELGIALDSLQ